MDMNDVSDWASRQQGDGQGQSGAGDDEDKGADKGSEPGALKDIVNKLRGDIADLEALGNEDLNEVIGDLQESADELQAIAEEDDESEDESDDADESDKDSSGGDQSGGGSGDK